MVYKTVFDVAEVGYRQWRGLAIGFCLVVVYATLFFGDTRFPYYFIPKRGAVVLNGISFVFACFFTIYTLGSTFYDYLSARVALESGHYSVVQGRITDFAPLPPGRTGNESFRVQGKTFSYSDYDTTAGFNQTKRAGGQLDNGVEARITYINNEHNEILRLEVEQAAPILKSQTQK